MPAAVYDSFLYTTSTATNSSQFELKGGKYSFAVIATGFGTVTLKRLGPDGTTFLSVSTAVAANGGQILDLAPGQYRIDVTTATSVSAEVVRIPEA